MTDPLIYSSIKNKIGYDKWDNYIKSSPIWNDAEGTSSKESILKDSVIKRACCNPLFSNRQVPVRIPLSQDIINDNNIQPNDIRIKYNYFDKIVEVPQSECDKYINYKIIDSYGGNQQCDDFYRAYCANILHSYKVMTGADQDPTKYNPSEFVVYKPECACFAEPTQAMRSAYPPPNDYILDHPECWGSSGPGHQCQVGGYKPLGNRDTCHVNMTVCTQDININAENSKNVTAGGINLLNQCQTNINGNNTPENAGPRTNIVERPVARPVERPVENPVENQVTESSKQPNTKQIIAITSVVIVILAILVFIIKKVLSK